MTLSPKRLDDVPHPFVDTNTTIGTPSSKAAQWANKDSERRLSLSIIADNVLALRQPSKTRKVGEKSHHEPRPVTARGGQSIM
jgi:hypothetical protein